MSPFDPPALVIRMDGPPVGKGRHRHRLGTKRDAATGKVKPFVFSHPDPKTANYEMRLAYAAQVQMVGRSLFDGPLEVHVLAFLEIPVSKPKRWRGAALAGLVYPIGKPDLDNLAKILDALNGVVWTDDARIVNAVTVKRYSDRPRLEISIWELPIWQSERRVARRNDLFG